MAPQPVPRAARSTSSATDASQLPDHGYGTRCQSIYDSGSPEQFKRLLKTFLFGA